MLLLCTFIIRIFSGLLKLFAVLKFYDRREWAEFFFVCILYYLHVMKYIIAFLPVFVILLR